MIGEPALIEVDRESGRVILMFDSQFCCEMCDNFVDNVQLVWINTHDWWVCGECAIRVRRRRRRRRHAR